MTVPPSAPLPPPPQIRVLEYDPDHEVLRSAAVFTHDNEVWDLAPSPSGSHVATVHSKGGQPCAATAAGRLTTYQWQGCRPLRTPLISPTNPNPSPLCMQSAPLAPPSGR
jgi:hypothetical protein